jgi:hypothetical protein
VTKLVYFATCDGLVLQSQHIVVYCHRSEVIMGTQTLQWILFIQKTSKIYPDEEF